MSLQRRSMTLRDKDRQGSRTPLTSMYEMGALDFTLSSCTLSQTRCDATTDYHQPTLPLPLLK